MTFAYPDFLYLLLLIPIFVIFFVYSAKKKKELISAFIIKKSWSDRAKMPWKKFYLLKNSLIIITLFFLIISLAKPQFGFRNESFSEPITDIVVAVDVSKSMFADDLKPSRIDWVRMKLTDLLTVLRGERIALVAFAGSSFLQCPLTHDYGAFALFLDQLESDLIPVPGTSLANALEVSLNSFQKNVVREKVILLLTDGEEHEHGLETILANLKKEKIKVFAIGFGTEKGIPLKNEDGSFRQDEQGKMIFTKLNTSILKQITEETSGFYLEAVPGDSDIKEIYQQGINNLQEDDNSSKGNRKVPIERYQFFAFLALLFLITEFFISPFSKKKKEKGEINV